MPARLPPPLPPAGTTRTFYAYHIMMDGTMDPATVSVGPWNQAKLLQAARHTNPGIVVDSLRDEGNQQPFRLAITLRNVAGRALAPGDLNFGTIPLQFRLHVGVNRLPTPTRY